MQMVMQEFVTEHIHVPTVLAFAGGLMLLEMLSWYTLGPLIPTDHCLSFKAKLSIVPDYVHPLMTW